MMAATSRRVVQALVLVGPSPQQRVAEVGRDEAPTSSAMGSDLTNMMFLILCFSPTH
jgi:hypothetical protein